MKVLLAEMSAWMTLVSLTGVAGCDSSAAASMAAEKMRNATRVELVPDADLFTSLTAYESVGFSSDQLDMMGFPVSATITDANTIRQLAQLIGDIGFKRTFFSRYPKTVYSMTVNVYRGGETLGTFKINGDVLYIPGRGTFRAKRSPEYVQRELRRILPCGQRMENAMRRSADLRSIALELDVNVLGQGRPISSVKDSWCDAILEFSATHIAEAESRLRQQQHAQGFDVDFEGTIQRAIEEILARDANGVYQCPFALNSEYAEDAPGDTILLFETQQGWNKTGGPELLSSRMAGPDGCFVYLKDWGVEFIPNTQVEEIKAAAEKASQANRPLEFRLSTLLKAIDSDEVTRD